MGLNGREWGEASLGSPCQSVVLGQIRGARARLGCQCHSGVPERIRDARISPGCQSQSGFARSSLGCQGQSGTKASLGRERQSDEDATPRMLRSDLCDSICCALLLHSNRGALVLYKSICHLVAFLIHIPRSWGTAPIGLDGLSHALNLSVAK